MIPQQSLLALLPPTRLDRLAVQYRVNAVNQGRLTGQTVFVCLLNVLVNQPKLTQRLLEETYHPVTGHTADHSRFGKRLARLPPAYLEAIFRHLYGCLQPQMSAGAHRALRLRIIDATTVVLSAKRLAFGLRFRSGGRAGPDHAKRHVKSVFALGGEGLPEFLRWCRDAPEVDDNAALGDPLRAATRPGDLWLIDRGLADRDRLLALHQAQGFFLLPRRDQKLRPVQTLWEASASLSPEELAAWAQAATAAGEPAPGHLLRVEQAVFENSNDAVVPSRQAKGAQMPLVVLHGLRYDRRRHQWQAWTLLTNLPLSADQTRAGPYPFAALLELYRQRWAMETFFKFLKQHLSYAHLTSRSENRIQVMIWMALIAAVLLIWYQRQTGIDRGWRSVKFWFGERLRDWTQRQLQTDLSGSLAFDSG